MRLAVLASGGGSNFQSILDAVRDGRLDATVALLVSNRSDAGALDRARSRGVDIAVLSPDAFPSEADYAAALAGALRDHGVDTIALAGYLKRIPADIVRTFRHRIVNVHPALLPAFGGKGMYGMHVHRAVIAHGVRVTGVTVHLVDEAYDTGPIILQEAVAVLQDDTPESLAARVLAVEHSLYPRALQLMASGGIRVEGRIVRLPD